MGPGGAAQGLGHPVSFSRLALSGAKAKARVPNHPLLRVSHLHIRVKYVGESRYHLVCGWQFRLERHGGVCLNQSCHVACSSGCKINMPRHVGIRPESVTTFRRQLNLYGRQMQAIPGYELNQSWHVPCKSDWKTNMPRHAGLSPGSVATCRLQVRLQNKHAKTCWGTTPTKEDISPAVQIGKQTCQDMSGYELDQS